MIEILSGKAAELAQVYHDPRPVLRVTHQLKREHVMEIVRLAVEQYGVEVLKQACGLEVPDKYGRHPGSAFYCWVPGRSHPAAAHGTAEQAFNEAVRLIETAGAEKVVVSQSVRVYTAVRRVTAEPDTK